MFSNFQTINRVSRFFSTNGESSEFGSKDILDSDSESGYKEEYSSVATEPGTSLYKKTENKSTSSNDGRTIEKEFGDSDDESGQERETFEGNNDDSFRSFSPLDEDEFREKSPGFDDFFRINENNIQRDGERGYTSTIPYDDNNFNGLDIYESGLEYNVSYKFKKIKII